MKKQRINICKELSVLFFCFVVCLLCLFGQPLNSALADSGTSEYTNVMTDLTKDDKFKPLDYEVNDTDYSVHVIQIAESVTNELFVYTYQPAGNRYDIRADYISISTTVAPEEPKWQLYSLKFLNCDGLFYKYVVNDFVVENKLSRTYNISEIFRPWKYEFDGESLSDNEMTSIAYSVAQEWLAVTSNGSVVYASTQTQVIRVTDMWCGTLTVDDGVGHDTDRHFVAFQTDKNMDKLLSADVRFVSRTCHIKSVWHGSSEEYSAPTDQTVTLNYDDEANNLGEGWFGKKYTWSRISSVEKFIKENNLSAGAIEQLANKQWVLNYYETDRAQGVNFWQMAFSGYYSHTEVTDVAILRLKFDMDGKVYDLGVVGNMQSPDDVIDGENITAWDRFLAWVKKIMSKIFGVSADSIEDWQAVIFFVVAVLLLIMLIPLIINFLPQIISFIGICIKGLAKVIVYLFKGIFFILSLPVRGIIALVNKIRDSGGDG